MFPRRGVKDFRKLPPWTKTLPAVDTLQTHLRAKPVMVAAHRCKADHSWMAGSTFSTSSPVCWLSDALMCRADEKKRKEGARPLATVGVVAMELSGGGGGEV